jgi:hypothetical protein
MIKTLTIFLIELRLNLIRNTIKQYVLNNNKLATKILYHCIEEIPVESTKELEKIKIRDLERDGRIVLSKRDKGDDLLFFMYMPFFFICLYNDALKIVDVTITVNIFRVSNRMFWQQWELFVLYHEAFHTNLAIKMGTSEMTFGKLYLVPVWMRLAQRYT